MLQAVIFDMDGVIIDSEPLHYQVFRNLSATWTTPVPDAFYYTYIGTTNLEFYTHLKNTYLLPDAAPDLVTAHEREFMRLLRTSTQLTPIPGVETLIRDLHTHELKIALASSASRENIEHVLTAFQLRSFFAVTVSGEEVSRSKPAPDIFLRAASLLQTPPANCLVIEDSSNGCRAAKAAGMHCLAYRNPNSGAQDLTPADQITDNFHQINYHHLKQLFPNSR